MKKEISNLIKTKTPLQSNITSVISKFLSTSLKGNKLNSVEKTIDVPIFKDTPQPVIANQQIEISNLPIKRNAIKDSAYTDIFKNLIKKSVEYISNNNTRNTYNTFNNSSDHADYNSNTFNNSSDHADYNNSLYKTTVNKTTEENLKHINVITKNNHLRNLSTFITNNDEYKKSIVASNPQTTNLSNISNIVKLPFIQPQNNTYSNKNYIESAITHKPALIANNSNQPHHRMIKAKTVQPISLKTATTEKIDPATSIFEKENKLFSTYIEKTLETPTIKCG